MHTQVGLPALVVLAGDIIILKAKFDREFPDIS
jgi:hypothetical protein